MLALNDEYLHAVGSSRRLLAGVIGLSGPYDFKPEDAEDLNEIFGSRVQHPETQPVHFVDDQSPPLLLLQGLRDHTVDPGSTRSLAEKVTALGRPVTSVYYPRVAHISMIGTLAVPLRFVSRSLKDIREFVDRLSNQRVPAAEQPEAVNEIPAAEAQPISPHHRRSDG